ncbi:MAG TPA: HNH endonuclease signature motif containing protein [Planctomycetota bacterium]|nr:HNH endonuclease signature motif containing protein [Planctomycetota bacterium]
MDGIRETGRALVRAARAQGAVDLAFGEALLRLFVGRRLLEAGYAARRDYARERLGIPARTMYDAFDLARACRGCRILQKAVLAGLVSPCHARTIAPVVASNEAAWTALAMTATVRELRAAVRAAGKEPPEEYDTESLRVRMAPAQQDRFDAALKLADETLGGGAPRWQCLEALAQEYLSEHGTESDVEGVRGPESGETPGTDAELPPPEPPSMPLPEAIARHLAVIDEAEALFKEGAPETADPKELDAFALRLLKARKEHDTVVGELGRRFVDARGWLAAGCATLDEYCTERLGMSPRLFRQRVWLERKMFAHPPLREAVASERLTYSKALLVARDATPETIGGLIERAVGTTWHQTAREATERDDLRNRARGVKRLWGPVDVMTTVAAAIRCAQRRARAEGREIGRGAALLDIADHFASVWARHRLRRSPKARLEVLRRSNGRCQVPGCSMPGRHVHHIRYRSRGGAREPWNETLLCVGHHLHGIHGGHLTVTGRAGERLVWTFRNGEIWVTEGDDDVRRGGGPADPVGTAAGGAAAAGADTAGAGRVSEPEPPVYGRRATGEVSIAAAA